MFPQDYKSSGAGKLNKQLPIKDVLEDGEEK